jgi:hypothetical protein
MLTELQSVLLCILLKRRRIAKDYCTYLDDLIERVRLGHLEAIAEASRTCSCVPNINEYQSEGAPASRSAYEVVRVT